MITSPENGKCELLMFKMRWVGEELLVINVPKIKHRKQKKIGEILKGKRVKLSGAFNASFIYFFFCSLSNSTYGVH